MTATTWILLVWLLNGTVRTSFMLTLEACVKQSHVEMHDPEVRAASCRRPEGQEI